MTSRSSGPGAQSGNAVRSFLRRVPFLREIKFQVESKFSNRFHNTFFVSNVSEWKRDIITELLVAAGAGSVRYLDPDIGRAELEDLFRGQHNPTIAIWGMNETPALVAYGEEHGVPIWRIEDGFIRSKGLGARHIPPASLMIDKSGGLYFRSDVPSELETFLTQHSFTEAERTEARIYMDRILERKITKYNLRETGETYSVDPAGSNVLVFGQCEDDNSILYGSPVVKLNTDLIERALAEFPDAAIYFRPHPDVTAGLRPALSDIYAYADRVCIMDKPYPVWEEIDRFEAIVVMTSLAGFEALMRGRKVRTFGQPFYAGWGLTNDFLDCPRRGRQLSLEEVFYGAYLHAPTYLVPGTGRETSIDDVMDRLT